MLRANHVDVQLKTPMIYEEKTSNTTGKVSLVAVVGTGWGKVSSYFNSVMQDAQLSIKSFIETIDSTEYDNFVMATVSSQEKIGRAALSFNNNVPFDLEQGDIKSNKSYVKKFLKNNIRGNKEGKNWKTWRNRAVRMIAYMRCHLQIQLMCQGIEHFLSTTSPDQKTVMMNIIADLADAYYGEYKPVALQVTGTTRADKTIGSKKYGSPAAVVYVDGSNGKDNESSRTSNHSYVIYMEPIQQIIDSLEQDREEEQPEEEEEETTSTEQEPEQEEEEQEPEEEEEEEQEEEPEEEEEEEEQEPEEEEEEEQEQEPEQEEEGEEQEPEEEVSEPTELDDVVEETEMV